MSIALMYPIQDPHPITRKKYYEFFYNLPVFVPSDQLSDAFVHFLNDLPISNFLHSRDALVQWVHMRNNHEDMSLGRRKLTLEQTMNRHFAAYRTGGSSLTSGFAKILGGACIVGAAYMLVF